MVIIMIKFRSGVAVCYQVGIRTVITKSSAEMVMYRSLKPFHHDNILTSDTINEWRIFSFPPESTWSC